LPISNKNEVSVAAWSSFLCNADHFTFGWVEGHFPGLLLFLKVGQVLL